MRDNELKRLNKGIGTSRDLSYNFLQKRMAIIEQKHSLNDSAGAGLIVS